MPSGFITCTWKVHVRYYFGTFMKYFVKNGYYSSRIILWCFSHSTYTGFRIGTRDMVITIQGPVK